MDITQTITSIIASVLGIFLAGQIVVWQHARADRQSAAGQPVTLPAAIRRTDTARGRLWRQGTITIHDDRVSWTPNTPWGRTVALDGVRYAQRRHPAGATRWLLPSAAVVVSCSDDQIAYEMAVLPVAVKHLFHAQFAR